MKHEGTVGKQGLDFDIVIITWLCMHIKPFTKRRIVSVKQVRGRQFFQGFCTVARVRFKPSALRLRDKNLINTPLRPVR